MQYIDIKQPRVFPNNHKYQIAKRIFDVSLCIIGAPIILLLMIFCAVAIWLDSPGPIFFVQERIGKGGRRFHMYKFRSMQLNSNDSRCQSFMKSYIRGEINTSSHNQTIFKPLHATRITRVGRFLRKTSLDELPQVFNVIKGEMSIVGPRPNVPWEVEEYRPWHYERLEVLPGITGLAQVRGRSCIDFISLVRFDIEYIEKQNFWFDMKILWWTFISIVTLRGAK